VEVGPQGVIATPDITYYASPDPLTGETRETPYISAHFLLDGCRDHETLWHELKMTDFDKVKRGARVRPVWSEERVGAITDIRYFEIIEEPGCRHHQGRDPCLAEEKTASWLRENWPCPTSILPAKPAAAF
jgi:hypothetical protein